MVPMTSFPISPCDSMDCPSCSSERTNIIIATFPKTFECDACGHVFMESKKSLIDE